MMLHLLKFEKKVVSMALRSPTGAQWTVKNESHLCKKKNTLFYSEFHADSEYVILFKKYWERKNGLTATCPFGMVSSDISITCQVIVFIK
jgi:hypothetical protein